MKRIQELSEKDDLQPPQLWQSVSKQQQIQIRLKRSILGGLALVFGLTAPGLTLPLDANNSSVSSTPGTVTQNQLDSATKAKVMEAYGKLPLSFEANQGQMDKSVNFMARGSGYSLFLTPKEAVLNLRQNPSGTSIVSPQVGAKSEATAQSKTNVLRLQLIGSNPNASSKGLEKLSGKSNYLTGNNSREWHTDISQYAKVQYQGVYPGIDLVYYGNQGQLEYDFIVAPGADTKTIRFKITGAQRLEIDKQGNLLLHADSGVIRQHKPIIYQEINGKRREVAGNYVLLGEQEVGFAVGEYDRSLPLVIDPVVSYSTYLGGLSNVDYARAIAVDLRGNVYVTGYTGSTDFPKKNAFDSTLFNIDVFVTKFNTNAIGSASLVYSTYLGGSNNEEGYAIAVDRSGNAYVTGKTLSDNFPTQSALQNTLQNPIDPRTNARDVFVTKLNAAGNSLLYSTYLGGNSNDEGNGIAVDRFGNAYVTGKTESTNFPTKNAYQSDKTQSDVFVTKLNTNTSGSASLIYSTYLGGNSVDYANAIDVDLRGNVYVTGVTESTDFPTKYPFDSSLSSTDAFVAKLNPSASGLASLVYSSYLGGSGQDYGYGIAVDRYGNAYVTGETRSTNFPTQNGLSGFGGYKDAFVTKVNAAGNTLLYSTYLGGNNYDIGTAIAVDSQGYAYVTGQTDSNDFPIKNAFQSTRTGTEAFVTKLNPSASGAPSLVYSSYLGGSGNGFVAAYAIAVDFRGNVYVTGYTNDSNFPMKNAYDSTFNSGGNDAFVTKISP